MAWVCIEKFHPTQELDFLCGETSRRSQRARLSLARSRTGFDKKRDVGNPDVAAARRTNHGRAGIPCVDAQSSPAMRTVENNFQRDDFGRVDVSRSRARAAPRRIGHWSHMETMRTLGHLAAMLDSDLQSRSAIDAVKRDAGRFLRLGQIKVFFQNTCDLLGKLRLTGICYHTRNGSQRESRHNI